MTDTRHQNIANIITEKAVTMAWNRGGPKYERGTEEDVKAILKIVAKQVAAAAK